MGLIQSLASLRFTLAAMLGLGIVALASYKNTDISTLWIALPLSLLAVNLLVVILTSHRFRHQHGLLVFHIGLLAVVILALLDLMTRFHGRLEITEGQAYSSSSVEAIEQGPWHHYRLDDIVFMQGSINVDYEPNMYRSIITSEVQLSQPVSLTGEHVISDWSPMTIHGYRFLATGNKGFSIILNWKDKAGTELDGAIHMPSFPSHDWKQKNRWITPGGERLELELVLSQRPPAERHWQLNRSFAKQAALLITPENGKQISLTPGGEVELPGGTLGFVDVSLWMGYRVDYQPWLLWQFVMALGAIVGLGVHFWGKFSTSKAPENGTALESGRNVTHV